MSEDPSRDEFRFVPGDAERVGRAAPLPRVERVDTEVSQGRRLSGLAFDPEQAPRIVTLHGAGLNAHSYDPTLLALDAPALSIDLPGHGRSDWRDDGDYRPDHLAVDIESALDALVPDVSQPFVLVGHSLGGLTASLVAASLQRQGKRRLSQLVIVDVTPGLQVQGTPHSITEFIQGRRDYGSVSEIVDRAVEFGIGFDRTALTRGVELNTRVRPDGRLEWTHHLAHLDPASLGVARDPQPYIPIWAALESLDVPITQVRADRGMVSEEMAAEWQRGCRTARS